MEERIDQYIRGQMTDSERIAFESELSQNSVLAQQVEREKNLVSAIQIKERKRLLDILKDEELHQVSSNSSTHKANETKVLPLMNRQVYMWVGVAAAAVMLLLVIILRPKEGISSSALYQQYAQHYNSDLLLRGDENSCQVKLAPAQKAYQKKNYTKAIGHFEKLLSSPIDLDSCNLNQEKIKLLTGISYLFVDQDSAARAILEELSSSSETARWYLGLLLLKQDNQEEVKVWFTDWLQQSPPPSPFYQNKVQELLKQF
ncbi:MAG: hypothetical protein AAFY71_14335 [Bacteroidota bacterium]